MKIKNTAVESTPFAYVVIKKGGKEIAQIRQYWSEKAGTYGHQVCSQEWIAEDVKNPVDFEFSEDKTSGCGYCKASHNMQYFLTRVFQKCGIKGHVKHADAEWLSRGNKAHKGGNYYEFNLSDIVKQCK